MNKHIIIAAALLGIAGLRLHAQEAAGGGAAVDFQDTKVPVELRVRKALEVLHDKMIDKGAEEKNKAAKFLFWDCIGAVPGASTKSLLAQEPAIVESALADPTLGGEVDAAETRWRALLIRGFSLPRGERIAELKAALETDKRFPGTRIEARNRLGWLMREEAAKLRRDEDRKGEEATLLSALPFAPFVLKDLAEAKLANGSKDALATAVQAWLSADYYQKSDAAQLVANALMVEPGYGEESAAAWIKWHNSAEGVNPLAKFKVPTLSVEGGRGSGEWVRLVLAGDAAGALAYAERLLAGATNQSGKNEAGRLVLASLANKELTLKLDAEKRRAQWAKQRAAQADNGGAK